MVFQIKVLLLLLLFLDKMAKMVPEKKFEWVELLSKQGIFRAGQWVQLHPSNGGFKEKLHPSIKILREDNG